MSQRLSSGRSPARRRRRGATMLEMTLVGIPTIFILISIFEISRGIWMYETLAYAAKAGVRFASVHGADCVGKISRQHLQQLRPDSRANCGMSSRMPESVWTRPPPM